MAARSTQLDRRVDDLDKAMKLLRRSMLGIQIRRAGFKKDHDRTAGAVGKVLTTLADAHPLLESKKKQPGTPAK
jgi:hypothetical protein